VSGPHKLAASLALLPNHKTVVRFDEAVDKFFDDHLRGRAPVDRLMYAASDAGDHSLIWLCLAGLEGWLPGRGRTWRPLRRAVAELAAESVLVNVVVKLGFRRDRPERTEPPPMHLRTPRTSSFPSGHSSSAFFAAALLRDSSLAPLYYALAAVVASSRIHVRIHYPSDVVAGAALGAVLGEVARRVYPLFPR
jgi:undecaprenyl-diphosphatase